MCYESSWYQKKRETDDLEKAKKEADKLIDEARMTSRKPMPGPAAAPAPVAEKEKETA